MSALVWLSIGLAGSAGALARAGLDTYGARRGLPAPVVTAGVNVGGSFVAGFVAGVTAVCGPGPVATVVTWGFLGAFTTFSTAMVQWMTALASGEARRGAKTALATLAAATGAAALGLLVASALGGCR